MAYFSGYKSGNKVWMSSGMTATPTYFKPQVSSDFRLVESYKLESGTSVMPSTQPILDPIGYEIGLSNIARQYASWLQVGLNTESTLAETGGNWTEELPFYGLSGNNGVYSGVIVHSGNIHLGPSPWMSFHYKGMESLITAVKNNGGMNYTITTSKNHGPMDGDSGDSGSIFSCNYLPKFHQPPLSHQPCWAYVEMKQLGPTQITLVNESGQSSGKVHYETLGVYDRDGMDLTNDAKAYFKVSRNLQTDKWVSTIDMTDFPNSPFTLTYYIESQTQNNSGRRGLEMICQHVRYNPWISGMRSKAVASGGYYCDQYGYGPSETNISGFRKDCYQVNYCPNFLESSGYIPSAHELMSCSLSRNIYRRQGMWGVPNSERIGLSDQPGAHYLAGAMRPTSDENGSITWSDGGRYGVLIQKPGPLMAPDEESPIYQIAPYIYSGSMAQYTYGAKADRCCTKGYNNYLNDDGSDYAKMEARHGCWQCGSIDAMFRTDVPDGRGAYAVQKMEKQELLIPKVDYKVSDKVQGLSWSFMTSGGVEYLEIGISGSRTFPTKGTWEVAYAGDNGSFTILDLSQATTEVGYTSMLGPQTIVRTVGGNAVVPLEENTISNVWSNRAKYRYQTELICKGDTIHKSGDESKYQTVVWAKAMAGSDAFVASESNDIPNIYPGIPEGYKFATDPHYYQKHDRICIANDVADQKITWASGDLIVIDNSSVMPPLSGVEYFVGNVWSGFTTGQNIQIQCLNVNQVGTTVDVDYYDPTNGIIRVETSKMSFPTYIKIVSSSDGTSDPYMYARNGRPVDIVASELQGQVQSLKWTWGPDFINSLQWYLAGSGANSTKVATVAWDYYDVPSSGVFYITSDELDMIEATAGNEHSGNFAMGYATGNYYAGVRMSGWNYTGIFPESPFNFQVIEINPVSRWNSALVEQAYMDIKVSGIRKVTYTGNLTKTDSGYYGSDTSGTVSGGTMKVLLFKATRSAGLPMALTSTNMEYIGASNAFSTAGDKWKSIDITELFKLACDLYPDEEVLTRLYWMFCPEEWADVWINKLTDYSDIFDRCTTMAVTYQDGLFQTMTYESWMTKYEGAYFRDLKIKVNSNELYNAPAIYYGSDKMAYPYI